MDPHRRPERGHAAGERLDHRQPEALVLRRHEHGVGGVDPVRAPRRARRSRASAAARRRPPRARGRSASSGRAGSCGKSRYGPAGIEPEPRARLGARDRPEALERDADRQHRHAPPGARARQVAAERARHGGGERREAAAPRASRAASGGRRGRCRAASRPPARGAPRAPAGPTARSGRARRRTARPRVRRRIVAIARSSARGPGGNANTSTSTSARRSSAATWSRTNMPRWGAAADGHMFVTTSARTSRERTFVTDLSHFRPERA